MSYSFPVPAMPTPPADCIVQKEDVVISSSLYSVAAGKTIWRVTAEKSHNGSIGSLIDSISKAVVKDLHSNKLIR